ncbi:hypothetical protein DID76_02755 [Candidatus Marinamargulisbacteria bacterium SCGC AG-414-C22]|nr:hypothetical protein DID76_02755 [Candidatus Marinamargulisbacteria bacterium SCGC AG-414-C22]
MKRTIDTNKVFLAENSNGVVHFIMLSTYWVKIMFVNNWYCDMSLNKNNLSLFILNIKLLFKFNNLTTKKLKYAYYYFVLYDLLAPCLFAFQKLVCFLL